MRLLAKLLQPTPHPGRWAALAFVLFLLGLYRTAAAETPGQIVFWATYTLVNVVSFLYFMTQHSRRHR